MFENKKFKIKVIFNKYLKTRCSNMLLFTQ